MDSNHILKGKKGLILGVLNESSIAWSVAERCKAEGASLVLSNSPLAVRFADTNNLAHRLESIAIPADLSKDEDVERLIIRTKEYFEGQFDFILHSVAMGYNIRKGHPYPELNHAYMLKTLDVSAVSFHRLLQCCYAQDALSEWGSVIALSFIASHRIFPQYGEMGDVKSLLEGIARSFGLHYGEYRNVRVNTISQSPLKTTAGGSIEGFDDFEKYADLMSPMGNADRLSLANLCTALFSDYMRFVTMQNIYNDGGFSATGLTSLASNLYDRSLKKKYDE